MTAVSITHKATNLRNGRTEVWGAVSTDGRWTFERTEEDGTPWVVTDTQTGEWFYSGSLPKARRSAALRAA